MPMQFPKQPSIDSELEGATIKTVATTPDGVSVDLVHADALRYYCEDMLSHCSDGGRKEARANAANIIAAIRATDEPGEPPVSRACLILVAAAMLVQLLREKP